MADGSTGSGFVEATSKIGYGAYPWSQPNQDDAEIFEISSK